jgi:hypothetical protein
MITIRQRSSRPQLFHLFAAQKKKKKDKGGGGQTMYSHVSKCKNNKIKNIKKDKMEKILGKWLPTPFLKITRNQFKSTTFHYDYTVSLHILK